MFSAKTCADPKNKSPSHISKSVHGIQVGMGEGEEEEEEEEREMEGRG